MEDVSRQGLEGSIIKVDDRLVLIATHIIPFDDHANHTT